MKTRGRKQDHVLPMVSLDPVLLCSWYHCELSGVNVAPSAAPPGKREPERHVTRRAAGTRHCSGTRPRDVSEHIALRRAASETLTEYSR